MTRKSGGIPLCLAVLLGARELHAQATPPANDRGQLIEQAMQAAADGNHAHAIELFTQAGRIEMRSGLRAAVSQQYEALGNHREACDFATRAVDEARADLTRPENGRALQAGGAVASSACPQVGRVHLVFPAGAWGGAQVTVQGRAVDPEREDVSVVVDPGAAIVQAVGRDGGSFRQEVTVRAGDTAEVRVAFAHPTPVAAVIPAPIETAVVPAAPSTHNGPGAGPWIVGGAGVLSLGVMGVFYGVASSAISSCKVQGSVAHCPPGMLAMASNAPTWALAGNVALGVGVAAIAGGVVWWLVGRSGESAPPVTVSVGQQGVTVGGRF